MNPKCEMQDADWEFLALGALDPAASLTLTSHLKSGCGACNRQYREILVACAVIGASLPGQAPSQIVEDRLAQSVKKTPEKGKVIAWPVKTILPWMVAAASLAWGFWMGGHRPEPARIVEVRTEERLVDANPELVKEVERLRAALAKPATPETRVVERVVEVADPRVAYLEKELAQARRGIEKPQPIVVPVVDRGLEDQLAALKRRVAELEQMVQGQSRQSEQMRARYDAETEQQRRLLVDYRNAFRTIEANGMRQVEMARVDPMAGKSGARALYAKDGGLVVVAHDLPRLTGNKCYQLWILRKGNPSIVSGGLMKLDEQGRGYLQSPPTAALQNATGFAITDEPEGGSVVARGRKLLFGAL